MSRIGKKPIQIPDKVTVQINGQLVSIKGPKGTLDYSVHPSIRIKQKDNQLVVSIANLTDKKANALWGTNRQMVANLITGVTEGYSKQLEINGVGYKAELQGDSLILKVGYSHSVEFKLPPDVTVQVKKNIINLESINKQLVGETAANIRKIKKPEPYKGKGIKYADEIILRKAGKQVKGAEG